MRRRTLLLICGLISILAVNPLVSDAGAEKICTVTKGEDAPFVKGTLRDLLVYLPINQCDRIVFDGNYTIMLNGTLEVLLGTVIIDGGEHEITISGNNAHNVFYIGPYSDVTMRNLKIVDGYDSGEGGGIRNEGRLTLEGCELSNNNATYGGAIFNENGAYLDMTDCRITNNQAVETGGGITNYDDADIGETTKCYLTNCVISGNQAKHSAGFFNIGYVAMKGCEISGNVASNQGGGLLNDNYKKAAIAILDNCLIKDNEAQWGGGGSNYGDLTIRSGTMSGNRAEYGGAISNEAGAGLTVSNTTFSGNYAVEQGGGIYNHYASDTEPRSDCTLTDSSFSGNEAKEGGGVANRGRVLMDGCEFTDNLAKNNLASEESSRPTGAGLLNAGKDGNPADATLNKCVFSGNQSESDGGAIRNNSQMTLEASELSGNSAGPNAGGQGGGIYNGVGQLTMTGCVLSGNDAYFGGAIANFSDGAVATLTNCTISGNKATSEKSGAIDQSLESPVMTLTNCTVASNAEVMSGILVDEGEITLKNTIVSGNGPLGMSNFRTTTDGVITSAGYNLANEWNALTPTATDLTADPRLEPLSACADGPMVHTLGADSPAIDAGTYEDAPERDQCGKLRFGVWDIGAWESPLMRMGLREALMALQISVGLAPAHRIKVDPIACWLDVSGDERVGLAEAAYALRLTGQSTPLIDPPCQSFEFSNDRVSFYGSVYRCGVVDYKGSAKFVLADDRDIGGSQDITEGEFCYSAEAPYQTVENCLYLLGNCLKTKGSYKASGQTVSTWDDQVTCFGQ